LNQIRDAIITAGLAFGESHIAAGANYVDVTHGLEDTPTFIIITPEDGFDAAFEAPRAPRDGTTFRVGYKNGVLQPAGTSGYFIWGAKV
jgi:hypothetical protein